MRVTREFLKQSLLEQGLDLLGVVGLEVTEDFARFLRWREQGLHGEMAFLEKNDSCRRSPSELLPGAVSAIVFALPYSVGDTLKTPLGPRIAQYARIDDYHRLMWDRGERVIKKLQFLLPTAKFRVVVDTAPLLERALASKVELGFIGKNTCFIHPEKGSFLLLGEILCDHHFEHDEKEVLPFDRKTKLGGCGPCDLCQVHCPTGALAKDYTLDAKLCLSYWTIEHRGPIPMEFWPHLGTYYFGCDLCQLACPYNHNRTEGMLPSQFTKRTYPSLFVTATMTETQYQKHFSSTALTRAKRNGLRRNALIAMAVTKDPRLDEAMELAQRDNESPIRETLEQIQVYLSSSGA